MATISEALAIALQQHSAGRLEAAATIYRRILEANPKHADSLHFLGVIAHQSGRQEEALELIRQAIELNGEVAPYHHNLGNAYHALGRQAEAEAACRRALELEPDSAEVHLTLANALRAQDRLDEAAAALRRALELRPDFTEAHHNFGHVLSEQGKFDEARPHLDRALELRPEFAEAHFTLGKMLRAQGLPEPALAEVRRALELRADFHEAREQYLHMLLEEGRDEEALVCHRQAVELRPGSAEPHLVFGDAQLEHGHLPEAAARYQRALEIEPLLARTHRSLGFLAWMEGRIEVALEHTRRSLELTPCHIAESNLAMMLLVNGEYEDGWSRYEARLARFPPQKFPAPRWEGGPIAGKALLLIGEQGFGDTLQFIRYAPLLQEFSGARRVAVACAPPLMRLLQNSYWGEFEFIENQSPAAFEGMEFQGYLPLMSAPLTLKQFEPLAMRGAYLRADPELRAKWQARLGPATGWRVAFVWRGNPQHDRDRSRSAALDHFRPLLESRCAQFYSLQKDLRPGEAEALATAGVIDLAAEIEDFADTAAIVCEVDLVIAVDTSLAHLAGALGQPVWTLLPAAADWRWGREGAESVWYPTMKLFRQGTSGDWPEVIRRAAAELESWRASRSA